MTDEQRALALATYRVAWAAYCSSRQIHFSVMTDQIYRPLGAVLPSFHWRNKNTVGVSFARRDTAAAIAWVKATLLAGYSVFWQWHRRGGSPCFGTSHIQKQLDDAMHEMPRYQRELKRHGIEVEWPVAA